MHDLPSELLLDIFENVSAVCQNDTRSTYTLLASASLVCHQWRTAAMTVLLSRIEVAKKTDAAILTKLLSTKHTNGRGREALARGNAVRELVLGLGATSSAPDETSLVDADDFHSILQRTPHLQKLVILHHNANEPITDCTRPLPVLPHLTHVTLASASNLASPCLETNLLQQLPKSVRHLSLPGPERNRIWTAAAAANLECHGKMTEVESLAIQEWPTPTSRWLGCAETMKELTCVYLGALEPVADAYPHLKSLRILSRIGSQPKQGFVNFKELESLEIRDMAATPGLLKTLPTTMKSLRFWSPKMTQDVTEMVTAVDEQGHWVWPSLENIVYDWFVPVSVVAAPDAIDRVQRAFQDSIVDLKRACSARGIALTLLERTDAGRSPGVVSSLPSSLNRMCYRPPLFTFTAFFRESPSNSESHPRTTP